MAKRKPTLYQIVRSLSVRMVELERELHGAGLHETAAAVNKASQRMGWEAAKRLASMERSSK